jgi:hypothetical protein
MDCLGVECDAMDLEHSARTIKPLRKATTSPRNVSGKAIAKVAGGTKQSNKPSGEFASTSAAEAT